MATVAPSSPPPPSLGSSFYTWPCGRFLLFISSRGVRTSRNDHLAIHARLQCRRLAALGRCLRRKHFTFTLNLARTAGACFQKEFGHPLDGHFVLRVQGRGQFVIVADLVAVIVVIEKLHLDVANFELALGLVGCYPVRFGE